MRFKVLALLAAVTLVAACSTAEDEGATTENTGTAAAEPAPAPAPAPQPVQLTPAEVFMSQVGDSVFFALDRSDITAEGRRTLDEQAQFLRANPAITITVEGHADERGTDDYNLALGARRAAAARDYLISQGISGNRINTISYGESRPFALGSNEAAWAQNRRALTVLTGGLGS